MLRYLALLILILLFGSLGIVFSEDINHNSVESLTKKYVETMEWDTEFYAKANKYASYKDTYIRNLASESSEEIFLSSVMLGLLKTKESTQRLKNVSSKDTKVKIGVSFALCMLKQDCDTSIVNLMDIGEITQIAGSAVSLKHLEAIELLSMLEVDNFIKYASKLKLMTEEVYQREAIEIAIRRYETLKKKRIGSKTTGIVPSEIK